MAEFDVQDLKKLYIPAPDSHKGQNGKVMVIAGSSLFHAAALWSLEAAAHLADMVYFASSHENNMIVSQAKQEFRNGIVIPRSKIDDYIEEADSILIGPGLPRQDGHEETDDDTADMTKTYLTRYGSKRWVIDGGSLQVMDPAWIPQQAILTPHEREFEMLFQDPKILRIKDPNERMGLVSECAKKYNCVIVLKGQTDIIASPDRVVTISGGNAGMTKGGTGDVLAGVAAGLYAKNDAWLSACAASYFNKKAAESLFEKKGYWYTASDLLDEIPVILKEIVLHQKL